MAEKNCMLCNKTNETIYVGQDCLFCKRDVCRDCLIIIGDKMICRFCVQELRQKLVLPELKIFSGRANLGLVEKICQHLDMALGKLRWVDFEGIKGVDEMKPQFLENIRGADIFLVQPTVTPRFREELLLMLDAARRASAGEITAVIPCLGYQRQERKTEPRVPISVKAWLDAFVAAGAQRFVFVDLHAEATQACVNVPVDHLWATPVLLEDPLFASLISPTQTVLATDLGKAKIVGSYAKKLGCGLAVATKEGREEKIDEIDEAVIIGDVRGKTVLVLDDIIKTAQTMCKIAAACFKAGALEVYGGGIHAELTLAKKAESLNKRDGPSANELIEASNMKWVAVTDSVEIPPEKQTSKIRVVSIAKLLADAIRQIHNHGSVSELFK